MNRWLTTHYAHRSPTLPWSVYLKDEYRSKGDRLEPGDPVLLYELKGKSNGREAIVVAASVAGTIRPNRFRDGGPDEGEQRWQWEIPCSPPETGTPVAKSRLRAIPEWSADFTVRLPGGLMRLDESAYNRSRKEFDHR